MTPGVNLHILAAEFTRLSRSAFFEPALQEFSARTADVIRHLTVEGSAYPDEIVRRFQELVWDVLQFVSGSRSNDAPHETQYVLRKALKEWIKEDAIVSSASLDQFNFFVDLNDLWAFIDKALNQYDAQEYSPLVVRIGSPSLYRHRPVYCTPLFHELGHFIDHHFKISETSVLKKLAPTPEELTDQDWQILNLRHRMEHFADLFASCYCGEATNKSLLAIAPNNPDSPTHPATSKRVSVVQDFLCERPNHMVDILQDALMTRTKKALEVRFSEPSVDCFDDVLTCRISSDQELYGIFLAAWNYLEKQIEERTATWVTSDSDESTIEKTVNDLTEKSIRNYEVTERWNDVSLK